MDHIQKTIDDALAKLREQETQVSKTKALINSLRDWMGQPPMFTDLEKESEVRLNGFRSDQFYGQALSAVVRVILESRKAANQGPASVAEIYEAMQAGGYKFEASNPENAKRALRISLTKNSATFHKLPNGEYGLREWYPNIKDAKIKADVGSEDRTEDAGESEKTDESSGFDFETKEKEFEKPKEKAAYQKSA